MPPQRKKPAEGEKFRNPGGAPKKFWGPFFQKFDGFWKKIQKINGFLAVLTVFNGFQCLHDEKKAAAGEKFGNPFFARRRRAKKFPRTFSFSSEDPPKKIW